MGVRLRRLGVRLMHQAPTYAVPLFVLGILSVAATASAGPLITAGTNLRNEVVTTGEMIGQAAIVIGFLGMMFENVRANHMAAMMWLILGGAGVWGSAAIINQIIV